MDKNYIPFQQLLGESGVDFYFKVLASEQPPIIAEVDFKRKLYFFKDIPKRRKYLMDRVLKIYDVDKKIVQKIIDSVVIKFRNQEEKGASDHIKRTIYVSLNEINKYDIKNENDVLKYFADPKSVIIHEATHIFQNIFKAFPDVKYMYQDNNGDWKIDYDKYVTDKGEIQSRIEQIIDMLRYGFTKNEIVEFLYNRKHKDTGLWKKLVDIASKLEKSGSSRLPGIDDDENVENEQGRFKNDYHRKQKGKNYEKDYLT